MSSFSDQIHSILTARDPDRASALKRCLRLILEHFHSETGTLHRLDSSGQKLHLLAESGLPPGLAEVVKQIPVGKGIAGQTVARGEPVRICNLQSDTTGTAQPAARQTGVGGSLCVPIRINDAIVGTLGIGTARPYEFTPEETAELEELGRVIARQLL